MRIAADVRDRITTEQLGPHTLLASERELAEIHGVSRMTARQALALLYLGMDENALSRSRFDSVAARVTEERVRNEVAGYRSGSPAHPEDQTQGRE